MNSAERKAMKEGLRFTGTYESDYPRSNVESDYVGKAKREAKRIRDLGFRAIIVKTDTGRCVYADEGYHNLRDELREKGEWI